MTIRVSYENTETGQAETAELPGDDWIVLCAKASDVVQAMFHGIASHNGMMREFRARELAQQAFDGRSWNRTRWSSNRSPMRNARKRTWRIRCGERQPVF